MSLESLKKNVIEKCENHFDGKPIKSIPRKKAHQYILKQVEKYLLSDVNVFSSKYLELKADSQAQKNLVKEWQAKYISPTYKAIFECDKYNIQKFTLKFGKCLLKDDRVTGNLISGDGNSDKSLDFFCTFLMTQGWNQWKSETNSSDFTLVFENSSDNKTITQRVEIKNLPKELNGIPSIEIENFVPRQKLLEDFFALLNIKKNKRISISGISGIGKTFLSKHFIQNYYDSFNHIVWLNCSKGLNNSLTQEKGIELLDNLGLANEFRLFSEGKIDSNALVNFATNRLRKAEGLNLLVLDNIDETIYDFEDEINLGSSWKIISTSQETIEGFLNYSIPSFYDESKKLFYKFYKIEKDDDNLIRLLSAIEYHTLTIELLAKTAQQRQLSVIELVNRFIDKGINIVEKSKVVTSHNKERKLSVENIETYLNIIFDTSSLSVEECKILLNVALLQNEYIKYDLFEDIYLSGTTTQNVNDILHSNIDILFKKGWLYNDNNNIRLHNLVKTIVINKFIDTTDFYIHTRDYLDSKNITSDRNTILLGMKYFTLSEVFYENTKSKTDFPNDRMKEKLGIKYLYLGLYQKSLKILENSDSLNKVMLQELNDNYIMASHLFVNEKYDEALELCLKNYSYFTNEENLTFKIDNLTKNFISYVEILNNSTVDKKIQESEKVYTQLQIMFLCISLYANSAHLSATVYVRKKEKEKAEKMFSQAMINKNLLLKCFEYNTNEKIILIFHKHVNELCFQVSVCLNDIGVLYQIFDELEISISYLKRSLEIRESILEENHPELSIIYHNLTNHYIKTKDNENANFYLEKNRRFLNILPKNHPFRIKLENDISILSSWNSYKSEMESNTTEKLIQKIETEFAILNKNKYSTDLMEYFKILGVIHHDFRDYELAASYFKKELKIKSYSINSKIEIAQTYYDLALSLLEGDKHEESLYYLKKAKKEIKGVKKETELVQKIPNLKENLLTHAFLTKRRKIIEDEILNQTKGLKKKLAGQEKDKGKVISEILSLAVKIDGSIFFGSNKIDFEDSITQYAQGCKTILLKNPSLRYDTSYLIEIQVQYYYFMIALFSKYYVFETVIKLCSKLEYILEMYFNNTLYQMSIITHTKSAQYYNLKKYEMAYETINKAISVVSVLAEGKDPNYNSDEAKTFLKTLLADEKKMRLELQNFTKPNEL